MATIYTIHKDGGFSVPCFDNQDEALSISAQCPVGRMFLAWEGVESASPCWVRFKKGNVDHYVAAFHLQFEGGAQAVLVALFNGDSVVHTHSASLSEPEDGNYYALAQLVSADFGPTCLGPPE